MFIPIMEWNDIEELDEPVQDSDSSCGCCSKPNQRERGVCICTDCKCHVRSRNITHPFWTNPVHLYGVLSVAMMAILFLIQK